jgi:hypothetical protein
MRLNNDANAVVSSKSAVILGKDMERYAESATLESIRGQIGEQSEYAQEI